MTHWDLFVSFISKLCLPHPSNVSFLLPPQSQPFHIRAESLKWPASEGGARWERLGHDSVPAMSLSSAGGRGSWPHDAYFLKCTAHTCGADLQGLFRPSFYLPTSVLCVFLLPAASPSSTSAPRSDVARRGCCSSSATSGPCYPSCQCSELACISQLCLVVIQQNYAFLLSPAMPAAQGLLHAQVGGGQYRTGGLRYAGFL